MEIFSSLFFGTAVITTLIALTLTWACKILNWVWLRPKRLERLLRQQGLNGNSYRFLFGDLKDIIKLSEDANSRPIALSEDIVPRLPYVHQSFNAYGKESFMWLGPTPIVNIMHPEQIKDIFNDIYGFQKPPTSPLVKLLALGLLTYEGDKWAMHRKIINPAFYQEKLKLMLPAFYSSCNRMVISWEDSVSNNESFELDIWPDLTNLTRDVISRTSFGSRYEEGKRIFELQAEQADHVAKAFQSVYIPGWRFVPTKLNRRMTSIEKEVKSLLRGIINKKENTIRAGEDNSDDLLGLLLESNMKEILENKNVGLSTEDVIEECKLFYFAGQETTSTLLVWTMLLLSIHPQWQDRAREEVLEVFGRDKPSIDGLNRLKIVTMILNEVLRLYPPVVTLSRTVYKEMKLGRLTIPSGVQVAMPTILVHHDQELWGEDAKEFKPERFSEGIAKATKNQVCFFPFGWGPRICIGQNFTMIEAKMALSMILQRFSFEVSPSYAHAPMTTITLRPQHGVQLILRKILSLNPIYKNCMFRE